MPTAHRLACFRDDVVFMVYLYQRWYGMDFFLYPQFMYSHKTKELQDKIFWNNSIHLDQCVNVQIFLLFSCFLFNY